MPTRCQPCPRYARHVTAARRATFDTPSPPATKTPLLPKLPPDAAQRLYFLR